MTVETAVSQPEKGTSTELGGSSQFVEAAVTCSHKQQSFRGLLLLRQSDYRINYYYSVQII